MHAIVKKMIRKNLSISKVYLHSNVSNGASGRGSRRPPKHPLVKRLPRKDEHQAVTLYGSRPRASCRPDATTTSSTGRQGQDSSSRVSPSCHRRFST